MTSEARKRFDEQFIRSQVHVFRYVAALVPNRDGAEEVFQDACLKILEKWQDYDPSRPMVPWACGIAQNIVRKFYDRSRRRGMVLSDVVIAAISETQHRLSSEADRRLQKLSDCLKKLPPQQRSLLDRCYGQELSIGAIAEATQVKPDALYKQLERIRRTLFECIESEMTTE